MASDRSPSSEPRVLRFRRRRAGMPGAPPEVADLAKYVPAEDAADYRHRMIVNAAAFLFVLALIGTGLWLVETMAEMRRDQDCVLSGRRGCSPVEFHQPRW